MPTKKNILMIVSIAFLFMAAAYFAGGSGRESANAAAGGPVPGAVAVTPASQRASSSPEIHKIMNDISDAFEAASNKVSGFVVPIFAEQVVKSENQPGLPDDSLRQFFGDDFFKRFFGTPSQPQSRTVRSLGSGVIVSGDGHILTNNHVVSGAQKLTVTLNDKKNYTAKIIGTDPLTDLALIKIEASALPAAVLGDSDAVQVGQWVIAVGNPFMLMHTVTHGIISAKGRSSVGLATYEDFFQTDAPINPGNSGGALADLDGNVIGINTAISTPSGGNVGLGFAIPINMAKSVMKELLARGKVVRGYVGVLTQDIDEDLAKGLGLKDTSGALISEITPDSPAGRSDLKVGDVVVEFNGEKIATSAQLRDAAAKAAPGTKVDVIVIRDGKRMAVPLVLGERPEPMAPKAPQKPAPERQSTGKLGLSLQTLTPDIARQLGYVNDIGVVITDVVAGSPADDAQLQRGDLIKAVNRITVRNVEEFEAAVRPLKKGDTAALLVRRGQDTVFIPIKIP
jgi:serine protease Do